MHFFEIKMDQGIKIDGDMILVPLKNKYGTIVGYGKADLDDLERLEGLYCYKHIDTSGKEYVNISINGVTETMHSFVFGKAPDGYRIDHLNSDGLDNRKSNLFYATASQNAQNRIKEEGKYSSDYTGVSFISRDGIYKSGIQFKRKNINIGTFTDELEAAKAYDIYAIFYFGKNAKTNNTLSDEEVENILQNGIPDKYKRKEKELPKNITYKKGSYTCSVQRNGKRIHKYGIPSLDEAIKIRDQMINKLENDIKNEKLSKLEIIRNKQGEAIIYLFNKDKTIKAETIVDDFLWFEIYEYKCYLTNKGYVQGYPEGYHQGLHTYLYVKHKGEIPPGMSVDHSDQNPLNNKLNNLRLGTPSQQIHNQKKREESTCHYKGVSISANKFIVTFEKTKWSFDYAEDAARKYNELSKEKYREFAYGNDIPNTKTTVKEYIEANIDINYINNITLVEQFKNLVRIKEWGGPRGYFKLSKIRSKIRCKDLEDHKKKAIELLNEENNGGNTRNKFHSYKGVSIHSNKFIVTYNGGTYSFDYAEDAAEKYNELLIKDKGNNLHESEINIIPDTKTSVLDLIPDNITIEQVKNIKYVADLIQIVKKKKWNGRGKHFSVKAMSKNTFERDKNKIIELLTIENNE